MTVQDLVQRVGIRPIHEYGITEADLDILAIDAEHGGSPIQSQEANQGGYFGDTQKSVLS